MGTPGSVASIHSTAVVSPFGVLKPDKYNILINKYGNQSASFFALLKSLGWMSPVTNGTYSHFEDDYLYETIKSNAQVIQTGPGVAQTIRLHADNLDSDNRFFPKVGMRVQYPNELVGQITAIAQTGANVDLTVVPVLSTDNLPHIEANDELAIQGIAFGEGSNQPKGTVTRANEITNYTQIFKDSLTLTGSEATTQTWVQKDQKGNTINCWSDQGLMALEHRMAAYFSYTMLFGQLTNNALVVDTGADGNSVAVQSTIGAWTDTRNRGQAHNYTPGSFSIANDFDAIARLLAAEYVNDGFALFLNGLALYQDVENSAYEFTKNSTDFTRVVNGLFAGDEALALSIGFKTIHKSGMTYISKRWGISEDPQSFGLSDYGYTEKGLIIPLDKKFDAKSKMSIPSIGIRFKEWNGINRMMNIWEEGSVGMAKPTNGYDYKKVNYLSEMGVQNFASNRNIIIEP